MRRGKVLQQNARQEIDGARHITDTEEISKRLILAWDCVKQIQDKVRDGASIALVSCPEWMTLCLFYQLIEKHEALQQATQEAGDKKQ